MIIPSIFQEDPRDRLSGVMATVISTDGPGVARAGDSLFCLRGRVLTGTIGGGRNEQQVVQACGEMTGVSQIVEIGELPSERLSSCGGRLQVKLERIDFSSEYEIRQWLEKHKRCNPYRLLLFGAGHVAREVAWLGDRNAFSVSVIDTRQVLLQPFYFPEQATLVNQEGTAYLKSAEIRENDFIVIAGPDHAADLEVLEEAAVTSAHYIGVLGSRRKIDSFRKVLQEKELWDHLKGKLYAPIGIAMPSRKPSEVAVSIMAQLIQVRAESGSSR